MEDGEAKYSEYEPQFKEFLRHIKKWYDAGYIDPEFATNTYDLWLGKWAEGRFGIFCGPMTGFLKANAPNYWTRVLAQSPDATWRPLPPPTGPDGTTRGYVSRMNRFNPTEYHIFSKDTSDAKMKKIMQIADALFSDEELYNRYRYGTQGEHWDFGEGGVVEFNEDYTASDRQLAGYNYYLSLPTNKEKLDRLYGPEDRQWIEYVAEFPRYPGRVAIPGFNKRYGPLHATLFRDFRTATAQFANKAILGQLDIDEGFNEMKRELKAIGLDEALEEYQQIYDAAH